MSDDSEITPGLTFSGKTLNDIPRPVGRPPKSATAEVPPMAVVPLIDQLNAEWERMIRTDPKLRGFKTAEEEIKFALKRNRATQSLRRSFLKQKAARVVAKRNGILQIPGYNDPSQPTKQKTESYKKMILRMAKKIQMELPPEATGEPIHDPEPSA